jgi:hypothetical protein
MEKIIKKRSRVRVPVFKSSWVGDWKVKCMDLVHRVSHKDIVLRRMREAFRAHEHDVQYERRKRDGVIVIYDRSCGEIFGQGFLYN